MKRSSLKVINLCFIFSLNFIAGQRFLYATEAYPSAQTNLAFINICLDGKEIKRRGYTKAKFYLQNKAAANKLISCNHSQDIKWDKIRLRVRGFSSRTFDKRQYLIKFEDEIGNEKKVKLLGLSKNKEFILQAPYVDRSFMRNVFVYRMMQKVAELRGEKWWAPKTRFVELRIDGFYQGLYVLTEVISRGKNRVDIPKLEKESLSRLNYIVELSGRTGDFKTKANLDFKYVYPSKKKLVKLEGKDPFKAHLIRHMILKDLDAFERSLKDDVLIDPKKGYRALIDVASAVDYFLVQEITKNIDGYRRSHYLYKAKNGKLNWGPLWDFNIAIGNLCFYGLESIKSWNYKNNFIVIPNAYWFKQMLKDPYFRNFVRKRYQELRRALMPFNEASIAALIKGITNELGQAPLRDQRRWQGTRNVLEKVFMNTKERAKTHRGNVRILRHWTYKRLHWMDAEFLKPYWNPKID